MPIADPFAADFLSRLADDISGPMAAGARVDAVRLGAGLTLDLTASLREAGMFLALARDLDARPVRVRADLVQAGGDVTLTPLAFAGWSEAGSVLPLHLPIADPETETVEPFRLRLSVFRGGSPVPEAEAMALLEGRLVSGRLGRLMAVLDAEAVTIRRHARAIAAARSIETAEATTLDRHGSDLGVPRQTARLTLQANGEVSTVVGEEPDADYRRRLAMYRATAFPRPAQYAARLGLDGPIAEMGFKGTLMLREDANPFSLAVQLISVGPTQAAAEDQARNFREFLRAWVLVDPNKPPPVERRKSRADATALTQLRKRLRDTVTLTAADAAMAPDLAAALDRLAALLAAMGVAQKLELVRALDPAGGSRYGMGLGIAIAPLKDETLDALLTAEKAPAGASAAVKATFSAMQRPDKVKDDPLGTWALRACGFRTVHLAEAGEVFLSHLTTGALTLVGKGDLVLPAGGRPAAEGFLASFTPESGSATSRIMTAATDAAAVALPGTQPAADPTAVLGAAMSATPAQTLQLRSEGLPAIIDWQAIRDAVAILPDDSFTVLQLPAATTTALADGDDAAWTSLGLLARALRQAGAATAIPLFTATAAAVVVATSALPVAGANLTGRASTGIRWFVLPIDKRAAHVSGNGGNRSAQIDRRTGPTTTLQARVPGLYALVALGYQNLGGTDPYEVRIEAGEADLLSYMQYEFLMNLLALRYPAGVEINTWPIRRFHVASDDGTRVALGPSAARTWRPFRRPIRAGTLSSQET